MRTFLVLATLVLGLSACGGPHTVSASPGPSSAAAPTSTPTAAPAAGVTYRVVAHRPVPTDVQGIALDGNHVAFVQDESRLVWMSWRTGDRRTVYRSTYGSLFLLRTSGRTVYAVDMQPSPQGDHPGSPRRYVSLDLATGRTSVVAYPDGAEVVGSLNDIRLEVRHGDLVEVDTQPHPDRPGRTLVAGGLVVGGAFRAHAVAWTQKSRHGDGDGHELWTLDLFHPGRPPRLLARTPRHALDAPVVGDGFVGWAEDDTHLVLTAPTGGPVTRVPGTLAPATSPSASWRLVAVVQQRRGRTVLTVYRVG